MCARLLFYEILIVHYRVGNFVPRKEVSPQFTERK